MTKAIFTTILLMAGLTTAHASYAIEGTWGTQQSQNNIVFDMTFSIHNNTLTVTNDCTMNGQSATARVTSAATYTDSTFTILAAAPDQESNPTQTVNCNVSVQPDTMNYSVNGNQLIFTHDGSDQSFALERKGN